LSLKERLFRLLRVPHRPELAEHDPGSVRVFKAAPGYLRYRKLNWAIKQVTALAGLVFGLFFLRAVPVSSIPLYGSWVLIFEAAAWFGYVFQAAGTLLLLRLDWEQRWYLISDRSLRVRSGLIRIHEKTTTFANIQNISVHQGPLQRLFGIADLEVRSAGGGSGGEGEGGEGKGLHTSWLRGRILDRVRAAAGSGLGDPDEKLPGRGVQEDDVANALGAAADELLEESRALHETVSRTPVRVLPAGSDDTGEIGQPQP
jgi:membrane protein YdbS with pleckstrin-like domain